MVHIYALSPAGSSLRIRSNVTETASFFLLEYSCFTVLSSFLLYNNVNQPNVYIYPLPLGTPSHPTSPI